MAAPNLEGELHVSATHRYTAAALVAASVAMALHPDAASAQSADESAVSLEEVVVTANKREQLLYP